MVKLRQKLTASCRSFMLTCGMTGIMLTTLAQEDPYPNWTTFTGTPKVTALASHNQTIWVGSKSSGLARVNKASGERQHFKKANSLLPSNDVTAVVIDSTGQPWIGTSGGLVKYEGNSFTVFKKSNSGLPGNLIEDLAIGPNGKVWVITNRSFAAYESNSWTVYTSDNSGLPDAALQSLAIQEDGTKWLGTQIGAVRFADGNWTTYDTDNAGLPANSVSAIAIDQNDNKWFATPSGLTRFNGSRWLVFDPNYSSIPSERVRDIEIDTAGQPWITTFEGLSTYNGDFWRTYNHRDSLRLYNYRSLVIGANNEKWIGTLDSGLYAFQKGSWQRYRIGNSSLPSGFVNGVAVDNKGKPWIVTGTSVAYFSSGEWQVSNPDSALLLGGIQDIAIDQANQKWVASTRGLARYDGNDWTFFREYGSGWNTNIEAIDVDHDGNIWAILSSRQGLARFDGQSWKAFDTNNSSIPTNTIREVAIDTANHKWLATAQGVAQYNGSAWTTYNPGNSALPTSNIHSITTDDKGHVWAGNDESLARFDGSSWKVLNPDSVLQSGDLITASMVDQKDNLWIRASKSGLVRYDGETFKGYPALPGVGITDMATTAENTVWISTQTGVARYTGDQATGRPDAQERQASIQVYPNPARSQLRFQAKSSMFQTYRLQSLNGQTLQAGRLNGKSTHRLDVSALPSGVYLLQVAGTDRTDIRKVVIQ